MFAEQRHSHILELLALIERNGFGVFAHAHDATLAQKLRVTEETVRRDLERLGNDGKLHRTHGGALLVEPQRREQPFDIRKRTQQVDKSAIATAAAALIAEGEVIAIDGSSSAFALAQALPDIAVTVITTSVPVVTALSERSRIRVVCAGGTLDRTSMSLFGSLTDQLLANFNIHKLFISCKGVDAERGLSETTDHLATVKRRLIGLADQIYLLADHTKFGVRGAITFAAVSEIDVVITDRAADSTTLARIAEAGPTIIQAG